MATEGLAVGVTVIVKSWMVSAIGAALAVGAPPVAVPLTMTFLLPLAFPLAGAVTVMMDWPEPLIVDGLKLAMAPLGRPEALSVTGPLEPFRSLTVTVKVPLWPAMIVPDCGETATEKENGRIVVWSVAVATLAAPPPDTVA
jgi:hypothetical protein